MQLLYYELYVTTNARREAELPSAAAGCFTRGKTIAAATAIAGSRCGAGGVITAIFALGNDTLLGRSYAIGERTTVFTRRQRRPGESRAGRGLACGEVVNLNQQMQSNENNDPM